MELTTEAIAALERALSEKLGMWKPGQPPVPPMQGELASPVWGEAVPLEFSTNAADCIALQERLAKDGCWVRFQHGPSKAREDWIPVFALKIQRDLGGSLAISHPTVATHADFKTAILLAAAQHYGVIREKRSR